MHSYYYKLEDGHCLEFTYDIILEKGKKVKMVDFVGKCPIFPRETLTYGPQFLYLHHTILRALRIDPSDGTIPGINDMIEYKCKYLHTPCGCLRMWYRNGKLRCDQHFYRIDNNLGLTGWKETYYENGQMKSKTQYRNGNHIGWLYKYFENGQLNVKIFYNNSARQDGLTFQFSNGYPRIVHSYDDGLLKEQIWYYPGPGNQTYSVGKYKHGRKYELIYYNTKGFIIAKHNYVRDMVESTQKANDYCVTLTQSKRHGMSLIYNGHPNERVINEIPYNKGIIEGQVVIYYNNGKLHKKFIYKNNRPNGYYEVYNRKGLLIECGEKSQLIGTGIRMRGLAVWHCWRKLWNFTGQLICEQYYEKGILIRENQYKYLMWK
jgi:antitoxin component YwqK of YwqJK toxin-antitoxin module